MADPSSLSSALPDAGAADALYGALVAAIDEAFAIIEVLFDADDRPVDYRFLETNPAFVQQTGIDAAVGRTVRELLPDVEEQWIETYGRVARTGESMRFQLGAATLGRQWDAYAFRIGAPAARRVGVLFRDVTAAAAAEREVARVLVENERARAAAERAGEQIAGILDATGEGILGVDLDGRTTFVNRAAEQLLGWTAAELVGRVQHALIHHTRPDGTPYPASECALYRAARAGIVQRVDDEVFWRRDGTSFPVEYTMTPITRLAGEARGTILGAVVTFRDITAQREADAERRRLLDEAQAARVRAEAASREADEANEAKSGFLATMSHELRTPINAVIGYAQLLELGLAGPLTDQQRRYLERMSASSRHLLGLVNDVLDLSKIEAGETRVTRVDARTDTAVRGALDVVEPLAAERGVRLVDVHRGAPGVAYVGDDARVRQIVLNLLSNAVKFTPRGGTVTIDGDTVVAAPAEANALHGDGPWAVVRVSDTGIGIAAAEQARIFDPFHQVQGGHTRTEGGTGLGLAISRRLARLMDGDLTVASTPGVGSTFTLWLPAARAVGGAQVETAAERSARAEHDGPIAHAPGLGEIGRLLREAIDPLITGYVADLRADPTIPHPPAVQDAELEDHTVTLLADLAQSLVIVGEAGARAPELLRDGIGIQRTIAEHHGVRRHTQGFDERALTRDHALLRAGVERAVRERLPARGPEVDAAVHVLLDLLDRVAAISQRAWRRAAGLPAA